MYVWIPNEVRIWGARRFYFVWALLFRDNVQTHLGGASIREGASNRDITVYAMVFYVDGFVQDYSYILLMYWSYHSLVQNSHLPLNENDSLERQQMIEDSSVRNRFEK